MLGDMKIFASVVALVLTAVLAGWLWVDATAGGRQEASGVLITGPVDPATATEEVMTPGSGHVRATANTVVAVLQSSADELVVRADQVRQAEREAEKQAEKKAAKEKAAKEKAAKEKAEREKKAQEKKEQQRKKEAVPVQPAPVNPGGWCEWDDDDGWECDDWDDD